MTALGLLVGIAELPKAREIVLINASNMSTSDVPKLRNPKSSCQTLWMKCWDILEQSSHQLWINTAGAISDRLVETMAKAIQSLSGILLLENSEKPVEKLDRELNLQGREFVISVRLLLILCTRNLRIGENAHQSSSSSDQSSSIQSPNDMKLDKLETLIEALKINFGMDVSSWQSLKPFTNLSNSSDAQRGFFQILSSQMSQSSVSQGLLISPETVDPCWASLFPSAEEWTIRAQNCLAPPPRQSITHHELFISRDSSTQTDSRLRSMSQKSPYPPDSNIDASDVSTPICEEHNRIPDFPSLWDWRTPNCSRQSFRQCSNSRQQTEVFDDDYSSPPLYKFSESIDIDYCPSSY